MLLSSQTPRKLAKVAFNLLTSARFYATHYLQQNSALRDQSENATRDRTLVDLYKNQKKAWVLSLPSKNWKEMSILSTAFYILLVREVNCRSDYKKGMTFLY